MAERTVYEIDGRDFATLEEFYDVVSRTLIPGADWGRNLNAFNDILRGGFGTPEKGFVLLWKNADLSRERLGYLETRRQLERALGNCHPSNRPRIAADLEAANQDRGSTVFDWPVEILRVHGEGGDESDDGVELRLVG